MKPISVGPNARAKLAEDIARPLSVPRTRLEGAELASMIDCEGKENDWAVTFQRRTRIMHGRRSDCGTSTRYGMSR